MHSDVHFGNQPKQRNAIEMSVRKIVTKFFFKPSYISLVFLESSEKIFQFVQLCVLSLNFQVNFTQPKKKQQENLQKHQESLCLSFEKYTCLSSLNVDF